MQLKTIEQIRTAAPPHMVGDGFKVRNFIGSDLWEPLSPFLMLDYMIPSEYLPTQHPRGVGVHPHKGFETVSILWEGALAHEDSSGGKGKLFAGDVQWMTAGKGILHKELHEETFSRNGGWLHGAQLWVNLPARFKSVAPAYQDIPAASIPEIMLADGKGKIRVIAGEQNGVKGAAKTFTRINVYDIHTHPDASFSLHLPDGDGAALLILKGTIEVNQQKIVRNGEMVVFSKSGDELEVVTNNDTHLLLLSGTPIEEPIASYGPFVMNTQQEIREAMLEYQQGKFGVLI